MTAQIFDPKLSDSAPLSKDQLEKLVTDACKDVLSDNDYQHDSTTAWNDKIIQHILDELKSSTKSYKYIVYCTLIDKSSSGPTGIRTTCGSCWDPEKDGVWNHKYEGKTTDAIVSIAWVHSG